MARFYGKIGYSENVESPPESGVWVDSIVEKSYFGDVVRNTRQLREGEHLNNDLAVSNSIRVVADAYAVKNFAKIRYIEWNGNRWSISEVEVERPRLTFRLGEVYNGPGPESPPL